MPPKDIHQPPINPQVRPLPKAPPEPLTGSPYDFIMDSSAKPKKDFSLKPGSSKLILVAIGGALLVVALYVILSFFSGSQKSTSFVTLAQQQAEISRVAGLQVENDEDGAIHNFVINTELSMQSDQASLQSFASAHRITISPKQIALGTNNQTDTALENANTSGTLDNTLRATLETELQQYQQTLKQTYTSVSSSETKSLLDTFYNNAALLLEQAKQ